MIYSWINENNKWKLILKRNNKVIDKFFLPSILDSDFFNTIIDNNGVMEQVSKDVFKIYFDKEDDVKSLVENFFEPRTLMFKMKSKVS